MIRLRGVISSGGIAVLWVSLACDGGGVSHFASPPRSSPATPTQISIAVQPGNALSGEVLSTQPVLHFRDANNAPIESNASVTAALSSSGGTLGGTVSVQAVNGRVAFTDLFVTGSGTHTLRFTTDALPAVTSASFAITTPSAQTASALVIQTQPRNAANRAPLGVQPVVRILDNLGLVISSGPNATLPVIASLAEGTGSLTGTTMVNAAAGVATFTDLQIVGFGPHRLKFSVAAPALDVTSASFAVAAGAPASLSIASQPSNAVSGQILSAVRVAVSDADGNPTSSADSITAALGSGTGALSGNTRVAAIAGVATFSFLTLAGTGPHTLTFSGPPLPSSGSAFIASVESAAITVDQTAAALSIETQPGGAISGLAFGTPPVVRVVDNAGLLMPGATNLVTASLVSGTGTLVGTLSASAMNGRATLPDLRIVGTGTYRVSFGATGLIPVSSADFTVTSTGSPASQLVVVTQPSPVSQNGVALAVQPAVRLLDANSSPVAQAGVVISAAMGSGGGTLGGTLTATTNLDGVATFANLTIGGVIGPKTLTFTALGVSAATSAAVNLVAGAPAKLAIVTLPPASTPSGAQLAPQPAIQVRDASDNDASHVVVVTAAIQTGGGTLGGTLTATTDVSGRATFADLSVSGTVGPRTLRFSATGLTSVVSGIVDVTAGAPQQLRIATQPSTSAASGAAFPIQPTVTLRDAVGNAVSQAGITVTAAIASGGGTLTGTNAVTDANGVAAFTDLAITGTVGTRTLSFGAAGLIGATSTGVAITDPPGAVSVATSTVSVSSSTVVTGATATLTLQAKDAANTNLTTGGLTVVFTATGGTSTGTIGATTDNNNGTYSAIFTAGTDGTATTIGATIDGAAVTSTLPTITVTTSLPAPNPNEPAGMTMYSDRDFNSTSAVNGRLDVSQVYNGATGWSGGTFSFSNGNYAIVSDPSAPVSPPNVAQLTYRVGLISGFNPLGPNSIQQLTVPSNTVRTLYTHQRIKLSANWLPPGNSNVAKLGFIKRQDNAPITYIVLQGSASPFKISFRSQNLTYPGSPPTGWQRNLGAASDDNFAVNVWNDLEILLTMNSAPGVFDGSVDVWLNGKHIISTSAPPYNGTTYARPHFWDSASNPGFWQGPSLEPTWGGADGWPNPTETRAWWDRFYVSGKP